MLEKDQDPNLAAYAQPPWNSTNSVVAAIRQIGQVDSRRTVRQADERFLLSIGNDHAGTYFPVLLPTKTVRTPTIFVSEVRAFRVFRGLRF